MYKLCASACFKNNVKKKKTFKTKLEIKTYIFFGLFPK